MLYFVYIKHYCIRFYDKTNFKLIFKILTYLAIIPFIIKCLIEKYLECNMKITTSNFSYYMGLLSILIGLLINLAIFNKESIYLGQNIIFLVYLILFNINQILSKNIKMSNLLDLFFILVLIYFINQYYLLYEKKQLK